MIIVGLTGGIGSGKTTVANMFIELGIPIYIADVEAKKLMKSSKVIKRELIQLFGTNAYSYGKINKAFLADKIFNDKDLLVEMNAVIHPKVKTHFKKWIKIQRSLYVIYEAAILFENGGYKECNYIITVTAPETVRIQRILQRDNSTKQSVRAIMVNQWNDAKKVKLSHFVIENKELSQTAKQVKNIHQKILEKLT
ncbi:dephospho-CoA kinase [Flavobacteriaceae bacterium PRS1]|nr:dephospho-CoA kinase [Flavobacteriaceae bacterium PRS1]